MGKVEDLEEKLYQSDAEIELQKRMRYREDFPPVSRRVQTSWREDKPIRPREKVSLFDRRMFLLSFAGFVAVLLLGIAAFLFFYLGTRGQEASVAIHNQGPLESGEIRTIPVIIRNTSANVLTEVELVTFLPPGSIIRENAQEIPAPIRHIRKLEDIRPGEERVVEITARMFGKEDDEKKVEVILLYRPENLRARFSSRASSMFVVGSVPLALSWDIPQTLARGQEAIISVHYVSNARLPFDDLAVRIEYPLGFTFRFATPAPDVESNIWSIGKLEPGEGGDIIIRGVVAGDDGEVKAFRGSLGVLDAGTKDWTAYSESIGRTSIAITPLSVQAFLNSAREGVITPGQQLSYVIRYVNNTPYTLKNIAVRAALEEFSTVSSVSPPVLLSAQSGTRLLDIKRLAIDEGGIFEGATQEIVWAPGGTEQLRELGSGQSGELHVSLSTRPEPTLRSQQDKNLSIGIRTTIRPADIPKELIGTDLIGQDSLILKVRSHTVFAGRSVYRASPIPNTGPLPPKPGQKTTYAIVWELRNFTNTLQNVEVITSLPPNVAWENVIAPSGARISFDQGAGQVRWTIGEIKAGVGVFAPALTAAFQVSIIPSVLDVGKSPALTRDLQLKAVDSFTGQPIEATRRPLTIDLPEDASPNREDWVIR
ncbi:MAG: hypothetical protein HY006_04225 [Candidatus Sungbacteria bacterium]|nr:hypothetical protein [Candidatus Sungbacteria bacterium]